MSKQKTKSVSQRVRDVLQKLNSDGRNLHTVTYQEVVKLARRKLKGEARKDFQPPRSLISVLKRPMTGGWKKKRGRPTLKALARKVA